jgi:polar amino acid transport system substrate-binding protein
MRILAIKFLNDCYSQCVMSMLRLLLVLAIAVTASSPGLAQTRHLIFATCEFPPYYGAQLPQQGPISEIISEAFKLVGYTAEIRFLPWARALDLGRQGVVDGLTGIWYSKEREQWFLFSNPLPGNEIILLKRKGDPPERFTNLEALKGFTIGTVRGYVNPEGFDAAGLKVEAVTEDVQNLLKLRSHHLDLVLIDKGVARWLIHQKMDQASDLFEELTPALVSNSQYLAISKTTKDAKQLVDAFNQGLTLLTKQGSLKRILSKHGL